VNESRISETGPKMVAESIKMEKILEEISIKISTLCGKFDILSTRNNNNERNQHVSQQMCRKWLNIGVNLT
jgi:hypothetical protein